jgi:hypothetical protein
MFKKIIDRWKKEWLEKKSCELEEEFSSNLKETNRILNEEKDKVLESIKKNWISEESALMRSIEIKKSEIEDLEKRVNLRTQELQRENENLKEQIRLIEAKSSPSSIWESAVQTGWLMAWDSMKPIMNDAVERQKKIIEQNAIEDTLKRISRSK